MLIIRMGVVEVGNVRISMISMDDVKTYIFQKIKLLGSNQVFLNTRDTWSLGMLVVCLGVGEVGNVRISWMA